MRRKRQNLLTLSAIVLAVGLFAVLGIIQTQRSSQVVAMSQDIPNVKQGLPTIGGAFELVDKDGKVWKDTDFKGKPMLVYFGYAYCPDVCLKALYNMTQAVEKLGGGKTIQPIFISLDPERDTPQTLKPFAENYHPDFIMLTGTKPQVDQALKAYRVHAARTTEDKDNYQVDHSSIIYLMGKDGDYKKHFNHETLAEEIVGGVKLYLEKGE